MVIFYFNGKKQTHAWVLSPSKGLYRFDKLLMKEPSVIVSIFLSFKTPAVVNLIAQTFEGYHTFQYDGTHRGF